MFDVIYSIYIETLRSAIFKNDPVWGPACVEQWRVEVTWLVSYPKVQNFNALLFGQSPVLFDAVRKYVLLGHLGDTVG